MSIIRADSIKNRAGNGAPDFPNGITVTGVVTATSMSQSISGNLTVTGNMGVGGVLTYEDVTNVDSVGNSKKKKYKTKEVSFKIAKNIKS